MNNLAHNQPHDAFLLQWALERRLPANRSAVLVALANNADPGTRRVTMSYGGIAAEVHCVSRTVERAIRDLLKMGLISRERDDGPYPATYTLNAEFDD